MKGPYPIFGRAHSGGRLLCEAFRQNGLWMGLSENPQRDAEEFSQGNPVVRELVKHGFQYLELTQTERKRLQGLMTELAEASKRNCPNPDEKVAYGWKRAVSSYACEIFLDAYPEAKTVHLIRDGRDVMLSRANARINNLKNRLNRLTVFGDADILHYHGQPFTPEVVEAYRNELEMIHWVTTVRFCMRARKYQDRYFEVRYEDLCHSPEKTMESVFEFIDVPFRDEARQWIKANASDGRIGKWKGREAELEDAIRIGEPLLKELGYV